MGLPWVQVERDFIDGAEPDNIAAELGIDADAVIGKAARAWAWSLDHAQPDGIVRGAGAIRTIERAANWTGQGGKFVEAFINAGLFEAVPDGVRFRGWVERYAEAIAAQDMRAERARKAANSRWGNAPSNAQPASNDAPSNAPSMPQAMLDGCSGDAKTRDLRPKTRDLIPETGDVTPPPTSPAGLAEVVELPVQRLDVAGIPVTRMEDWVRWKPTADGCWEGIQRWREIFGLQREAKRPKKFDAFFAREYPRIGTEGFDKAIRKYLGDPTIRTPGHPTALFIKPEVFNTRTAA